MGKLHQNAGLTIVQRVEVKRLYEEEKVGQSELARRYSVSRGTIQRWVKRTSPQDRSSAPRGGKRVVTEGYREAVIAYRERHPQAGPIRIASALQAHYPFAHRGTVRLILVQAGKSQRRAPQKEVGRD